MLAATPEENVIDRCSLEGRLEMIDEQLQVATTDEQVDSEATHNLREEERELEGEFSGVLTLSRTFEFKLLQGGEGIRGKVAPTVPDIEQILQHTRQRVRIRVMQTRIGNGRPRYLLLGLPKWPA
jgi:hypothetical protein